MKKGFTLAEVLIVLGIIGIVAELTIPTLMNQVGDAQTKSAWKKMYSISSQAVSNAIQDNGGSLVGLFTNPDAMGTSIKTNLKQYFSYAQDCDANASSGICFSSDYKALNGSRAMQGSIGWPAGLLLKDGSSIVFKDAPAYTTNCNWPVGNGLLVCGYALADVNGPNKKPNTFGKDIFFFWVLPDRIVPEGSYLDGRSNCSTTDGGGNAGSTCSAKYLLNQS